MERIRVVDSHTEGEPTRVVLDGAPDLGGGSVAAQARVFRERFDGFRASVVNEPRGHDALVGALIVPSPLHAALCGVIFFNNVGLLSACGHGTIGLAETLAFLGRLGDGEQRVETPVGLVRVRRDAAGVVEIDNVESYRQAARVPLDVKFDHGRRTIHGDVAWGGNWFFLVADHGLDVTFANLSALTRASVAIRSALERDHVTGLAGAPIDHVELFGPALRSDCDSKNFVLCPGEAYDRSPCGTGTSAKMACLVADGKLGQGDVWRQESIVGSRFTGRVRVEQGRVLPTISGRAWITAESVLLVDPRDPFRHGIR